VSEDEGPYRVVASEQIYRGTILGLRRDQVRMSDGNVAAREVVEHPGAVGVVAVDDGKRVVLVNQYRHPVGRRLDELPAGLLDKGGEEPLAAARRELAEEARVRAARWDVLLDLNPSPGMSDEAIRIYLARGLEDAAGEFTAEHEEIDLTVTRVPLDEAVERVLCGEITNAAAVAGVLAAARSAASGWAGLRPADAPWPSRRPQPLAP
jgi:ADP-ribose pyrophosphatase